MVKGFDVPEDWNNGDVYNIKLGDIHTELSKWEYFGMNESLAKQELSKVTEGSVNVGDYLFNEELIQIESMDWSIQEQAWLIKHYDFENNIFRYIFKGALKGYRKIQAPKYELNNNYRKTENITGRFGRTRQVVTYLKIIGITYAGGHYNYKLHLSDGRDQIQLSESDLEDYINEGYKMVSY